MKSRLIIAGLMVAGAASSQTQISLSSQAKDVDFSNASSTRPFRSGVALPSTCGVGDTFYLLTATPGTNLYSCTLANQWTPLAGSSLPSATAQAGAVLTNDGNAANWVQIAGDVSGAPGTQSVQGLRGIPLGGNPPVDRQALVFNASMNRWQPGSGGNVPDWPVTRTSDTVLTVGSGPGLRIGGTYCQVPVANATVTVGGGTGTIFLFIRPDCELVAAHNLVVSSCLNCTAAGGASYEPNSFPLGQWTVTGGVLATQGTLAVTPYAIQPLLAGQNIQLTYSGGTTQVNAPSLTAMHPVRMIGYTFDVGGTTLSPGVAKYLTVPFACTLSGWNIAVDRGAATIQIWKVPTGTAIPIAANTISRNGVTISSGTAIHSGDISDFTSTAISADDILAFNLSTISSATYVNVVLECIQ